MQVFSIWDRLAFCVQCYYKGEVILHRLRFKLYGKGRRCGRHRMVVGFTTTYAISAYHHRRIPLRRSLVDSTLYDKVC